jgi:hypothetical protein
MEFVLMERLWADSSGQDSYDPYTCAVHNALFFECLDIAGARTLASSLSGSVAYNMSGSSGDLNKNFYAILALEGLFNMSGTNTTGHFGGDISCSGKNVGDGAVNAYDMAALMWYQFKFEPYDVLPNDPSVVVTVQGRDDTGYRCGLGETRRMWQSAIGEDYCHNGQNARMLGYEDSRRRLTQNTLTTSLVHSLSEASSLVPLAKATHHASDAFPTYDPTFTEKETRPPLERRETINDEDRQRDSRSMRSLDIDVSEWGVVSGYGRWIRIRAPGVQIATEIYLAGISVDEPVHLSLQPVPKKNCTSCVPEDSDPSSVVLAFARRSEYEEYYSTAVTHRTIEVCASIVPAVVQSHALLGNTIGIRQQPPNKACAFDLFLWVPASPKSGVHVSRHSNPYSHSARRLAAVGAESAVGSASSGCDGDIGVLSGSSAMDGYRGQVQRALSCARYEHTRVEALVPVNPVVAQCGRETHTCSINAITASAIAGRFTMRSTSSAIETAYVDSLQMLNGFSIGPRSGPDRDPVQFKIDFEASLARNSLAACCPGTECVDTGNETALCVNVSSIPPHIPSPFSPSPSAPPPPVSVPLVYEVVFNTSVSGSHNAPVNKSDYALRVAAVLNIPVKQVEVVLVPGTSLVQTTVQTLGSNATLMAASLQTHILRNTTTATRVLGIPIDAVYNPKVVVVVYSPPSAPPQDSSGDDGMPVWAIVVIILAAVWIVGLCVGLLYWLYKKKDTNKGNKRGSERKHETTSLLAEGYGGSVGRQRVGGKGPKTRPAVTGKSINALFRLP